MNFIGYETKMGTAKLGDSREIAKTIENETISLILTSPPFPLLRKKEYGNENEDVYIEWILSFIDDWKRILKEDGSLVIDLGGAYKKGQPIRSIYQFELLVKLVKEYGFNLAQEFYHYNPARLPSPAQWVNVERIRVKDAVNTVWWLSKSPRPKASNKKILQEYSSHMKKLLSEKNMKEYTRPSGHSISKKFMIDNGGSIPTNLIELNNTNSNGKYLKKCREMKVKPHPARFHEKFAEFFIKFLTDENDLVYDPFGGSNTTGFVAETHKRKWIVSEMNKEYLMSSRYRWDDDIKILG